MIQWPSTCLASRTCTPHAGAHPDFFHTLKFVVLDPKSKPATENEAEPFNVRISSLDILKFDGFRAQKREILIKMDPDTKRSDLAVG